MSEVLTLRMTPEEMLRFKLSALSLKKKRAAIVRERVADLIGGAPPTAPAAATAPVGGDSGNTVINGHAARGGHAEDATPEAASMATGNGSAS